MGWSQTLFGFGGRLSRAKFWPPFLLVEAMYLGLLVATIYQNNPTNQLGDDKRVPSLTIVLAVISPVALWSNLALQVKRFHDLNRSGFWAIAVNMLFAWILEIFHMI